MNPDSLCPSCGAPLVAGPGGLTCAACLLRLALGPAEPVRMAPMDVLEPAVLQPWFPDLEILEVLGMGGMGVVYKVRQPTLDRLAALKVLPKSLVGQHGFRDRFEREARTLAALVHPNIVTIHDFGERGGHYFLLMEYVGGGDLARLLAAGNLSGRQALALVPPLCDALQCAHEHGVIHRDIKPANILLDDQGRVKIADFGVAKILGQAGTDAGANDYLLGTPAYMAPEERSAPQTADHRADIYSLGVLIYEMLTGRSPGTPPDPPSRHCRIDHRIDDIVMRALAADPDNRQQHIEDLRKSLEKILRPGIRPVFVWSAAALLVTVAVLTWQLIVALKPPVDPLPPIWKNSVGMPFRPLPGSPHRLCIRETTIGDWQQAARDLGRQSLFNRSEDHLQYPMVLNEVDDAEVFCRWLTRRDRAAGAIGPMDSYRLPTDAEWSLAAGVVEPSGANPAELHLRDRLTYPWGKSAPAPAGTGNYPDAALAARWPNSRVIPGYYDGHAFVAPACSFSPNPAGFFDLGGNVWEKTRTPSSTGGNDVFGWRGGSWNTGAGDANWQQLLVSWRGSEADKLLATECGFRVLLDRNSGGETSLLAAIRLGNSSAVRKLVEGKHGLTEKDIHGVTPLIAAAAEADVETLSLLLDTGMPVDAKDDRGQSALHFAARRGDTAAVRLLLSKGAQSAARDLMGRQAIHLAAGGGHIEVLELLANNKTSLQATDVLGGNPLTYATFYGQTTALVWLYDHGGKVPHLMGITGNPLVLAVSGGHEDTVDVLLARGVGVMDSDGDSLALRLAALNGRAGMFHKMLAAAPDPLPDSLLHAAASSPVHNLSRQRIPSLLRENIDQAMLAVASNPGQAMLAVASNPEVYAADKETIIRLLVGRKVPLENKSANGGFTPLLTAAYQGDATAAKVLLDLGADITARDTAGFTALHSAAEQNHPAVVQLLLARGADINALTTDGRTVLGTAMGLRSEAVVEMLLKAGANPDTFSNGLTPLGIAAQRGQPKNIALLLLHHADANLASRGGHLPLAFASQGPTAAIRQQADMQGKQLDDTNNYPVTLLGSEEDYLQCIRLLVDAGALVQPAKPLQDTALHAAACWDFEAAVILLLERGAPVDFPNASGITPLYVAASGNALRVASILLDHGAAAAPPAMMESCLHAAARGGHVEMMALLLEHGANPNAKDGKSATPLHWAVLRDKPGAVRLLASKGADVNARDFGYCTPLHIAAALPHPEVISALLESGADPKARNIEGATARHIAEFRRQTANATILRQAEEQP